MRCVYCGAEKTWRNEREQYIDRMPTWMDLWPCHRWVEEEVK